MRILRLFCLALLAVLAGEPALAAGKPSPTADAKSIVLMDAASGMLLLARAPDTPFPPASLAKLMTLDVAFDLVARGKLSLGTTFPISLHAWRTGGGPARVSAMFAAVKSEVAVRDLIRGIAVVVGNDAAIALAEGISGSETAFAVLMNARAKTLGLNHSHFVNATGLPEDGQSTTARDLALVARDLAGFTDLYKAFAEPRLDWNRIDQRNRNPLLSPTGNAKPYDGADGLMVGSDADFGAIIVASAARGGRRLIAVAAGLADPKARDDAAAELLDRGFDRFAVRKLFTAGQSVAEARVFGGTARHVALIAPGNVAVLVPKGEGGSELVARVSYRGPVRAPFAKGETLATLRVWRDGLLQAEEPLVAATGVERGELWDRAFDATYEIALAAVQLVIGRL